MALKKVIVSILLCVGSSSHSAFAESAEAFTVSAANALPAPVVNTLRSAPANPSQEVVYEVDAKASEPQNEEQQSSSEVEEVRGYVYDGKVYRQPPFVRFGIPAAAVFMVSYVAYSVATVPKVMPDSSLDSTNV